MDNQTIGKDVWFDDVQVLHYNTQVLEENHYYPFGLTISTTAMGMSEQPYKYQGIELQKSFGLETYETNYRRLDPQLGRFMQIDPLADNFTYQSPYASMDNNPVSNTDPDGLFSRFGAWWRNIWWDGNGITKNDATGEWGVHTSGTDWDGTVMVQVTYKGNPNAFPNQIREHYIEQRELKQFWEESGFETEWVETKEEQVTSFIQFHGKIMIANAAPQMTAAMTKTANLVEALSKVGGNSAASKFLGWGNKTQVLKSASDFTKEKLIEAGYTKKVLKEIYAGLMEAAKKTIPSTGKLNPASVARAEQIKEILKMHF